MELALDLTASRARRDAAALVPIVAPLALVAVVMALVSRGLVVQDSWLALVGGREVAAHGLPHVDHLAAMTAGHAWVDQQWLAQLLLYGVACAGGPGLAFAACLLAELAALGLAADVARRRGASPLAILLVLVAAVAAAPWGLQARPQSLALLLFSLTLWLLARDARLLVVPVLVVWANVHGSAVLGVALLLAYALSRRAWRLAALAPATLLASPYAAHLPAYYRTMLLDPPFGRLIREWARTTPSPLTAVFFALAAVVVVLAVRRRPLLSAFDRCVLALTLATALDAMRGIVWFALAAVALLPALATRRPPERPEGRFTPAFAPLAVLVALAALGVAAARDYAPAAAAAVRPGDRVLADEADADALLWQLPSLRGRVAYDVRFELMRRPQIERLVAWRHLRPGWRRAVAGYTLVVDDRRHVSRLVASGGWVRVAPGVARRR